MPSDRIRHPARRANVWHDLTELAVNLPNIGLPERQGEASQVNVMVRQCRIIPYSIQRTQPLVAHHP